MDIQSLYTENGLDMIITEFEAAMLIDGRDYEETSFDVILRNVYKRISRSYQIDLTLGKINDLSFESGIYRAAVSIFIDNIAAIHAKLCAFCQIERFKTISYVSLDSVNYLSYKKESMQKVLKLLQRERTQFGSSAFDSIEQIKTRLAMIRTCREKRLFMIMVISYEMGFMEVVSTIAEILYFGGVL